MSVDRWLVVLIILLMIAFMLYYFRPGPLA
jgi:hypothetical protein